MRPPLPSLGVLCVRSRHLSSIATPSKARPLRSARLPSLPPARSSTASSASSPQPEAVFSPYDFFPETLPNGPPPSGTFAISTPLLRREFLRLQVQHHPDKHPPSARSAAQATSAAINEAYRTLSSPLLRAQWLLRRRGIDVATDERLGFAGERDGGEDLLACVMEAHEALEEAACAEDVQPLRERNDGHIGESEERLARAFAEDDVDAAKKEALRLRYWVNIKESLDAWEEGKPVVLQH